MYKNIVNLDRYPLDRPNSDAYQQVIAESRTSIAESSIATLEGFLTPKGIDYFQQEIEARMSEAFHSVSCSTPYFETATSEAFADEHPHNFLMTSERYGLAHHQLMGTTMYELYHWTPMRTFIKDICQVEAIYCSADPSNGLVAQIYKQGCNLPGISTEPCFRS